MLTYEALRPAFQQASVGQRGKVIPLTPKSWVPICSCIVVHCFGHFGGETSSGTNNRGPRIPSDPRGAPQSSTKLVLPQSRALCIGTNSLVLCI